MVRHDRGEQAPLSRRTDGQQNVRLRALANQYKSGNEDDGWLLSITDIVKTPGLFNPDPPDDNDRMKGGKYLFPGAVKIREGETLYHPV